MPAHMPSVPDELKNDCSAGDASVQRVVSKVSFGSVVHGGSTSGMWQFIEPEMSTMK